MVGAHARGRSLLVYDVAAGAFAHYDPSLGGGDGGGGRANHARALDTVGVMIRACHLPPDTAVSCPPCARMTNGHDCGVYAIAYADALAGGRAVTDITPADAVALRARLVAEVARRRKRAA